MSALTLLLAAMLVRGDTSAAGHYQPYRFLVGEWTVGSPGAAPMGVIRFRFGPGESYLWLSMSMLRGAPVSLWTVSRELGHSSTGMIERTYGHLGTVRHRAEVVEYRLDQHRVRLGQRLEKFEGMTPAQDPIL
jgi:hypothetical protein